MIVFCAGSGIEGMVSSDEEEILPQQSPETEETEDEGQFVFRRNKLCTYHMVSRFHFIVSVFLML